MRKNKFFNGFYLILICVYLVLILLHTAGVYPFSYILGDFWFEIFLGFMAILLLTRAVLFRSDSSTIIGSILLLNAILFLVRNLLSLKFLFILPIFIFTFAVGSLVGYMFFKNKLYLKTFGIIFLISIVSCSIYFII